MKIISTMLLSVAVCVGGEDSSPNERRKDFERAVIQEWLKECVDADPQSMIAHAGLESGPAPWDKSEKLDQSYYLSYGFVLADEKLSGLLEVLEGSEKKVYAERIIPDYAIRIHCFMTDKRDSIIEITMEFRVHRKGFLVCYLTKGEYFFEFVCSEEVVNYLNKTLRTSILDWEKEVKEMIIPPRE